MSVLYILIKLMWNIIYAGSLAVSVAVFRAEPIPSFKNSEISPTQEQIIDRLQLAKGRRYESDYRNEADRARERHHNREHYRRENYRYDPYEVEYDRDGRGRIHRDAEQRRREENLESEQPRDRPRRSRDRRRDRSRDRHHSIYYWRQNQ